MKKYLSLLFVVMMTIVSCQKFDDSKIWDKLNDHETRIAYLEEVCKNMNTSIVNLQTVVTALETNDYIISASPLVTGDGYTFLFKSGKSIVIYNGKDGQNGTNGTNGATPVISVRQDTDGYYYWTVDGDWLIVDGKKVKAAATDGENGENGTNGVDGITPKFKIEEDYWYVSYDNGQTWEKLGKATGNNGLDGIDGEDGDNLFKKVFVEDGYVQFVLNDEFGTIIKLPLQKETLLQVSIDNPGTLRTLVSSEEVRVTTKLKVSGDINNDDMKFLQHFTSLVELDLSQAVYQDDVNYSFRLNPYGKTLINRTLSKVWLPTVTKNSSFYYSYCSNLEHIIVSQDGDYQWGWTDDNGMDFCPIMNTMEYAEGVKDIPSDVTLKYSAYNQYGIEEVTIDSKYSIMILPSTTETVHYTFLRYDHYYQGGSNHKFTMSDYTVVCKALTPPNFYTSYTNGTHIYDNCTLYVPSESIKAYKEHTTWGQFNVLPIE